MQYYARKAGAIAASTIAGALALFAVLNTETSLTYHEFIVGSVTWNAGGKLQDLLAWPAFLSIYFISLLALDREHKKSPVASVSKYKFKAHEYFHYISIPGFIGISALLSGKSINSDLIFITILGAVTLIALKRYSHKSQSDFEFNGGIIIAILLSSIIPLEISTVLNKVPVWLTNYNGVGIPKEAVKVFLLAASVITILLARKNKEKLNKTLPAVLLFFQIFLSTLYLTLYPAKLLQRSGEITQFETTSGLWILIMGFILLSIADTLIRFFSHRADSNWRQLLSPTAMFGLLIFINHGSTVAPYLSPDDYHFGESLLGVFSYSNGALPYIDYLPPHGMVDDDFRLFISTLLYNGSAASVPEAGRVATSILGYFAFIAIFYYSRSLVLAFTAVLLIGSHLGWLFLTTFICLLLSSSLRLQPSKWLAAWFVAAPIIILGIPAQGSVLIAALSPLAGKMLYDQIKHGSWNSWLPIATTVVLMTILVITTPLADMLSAAIRYVFENGSINQAAYGIPWSQSWAYEGRHGIFFESLRMAWVAFAIICLHFIKNSWRNISDRNDILYTAICFLFLIILLIPYTMGRIDPGHLSRAGTISILALTVFLPILVWKKLNNQFRAIMVLFACALGSASGSLSISSDKVHFATSYYARAPYPQRIAKESNLDNIGTSFVRDDQWDRITGINSLLRSKLKPTEKYLDLTSRNANYFYLNRHLPVSVSAPYNLVSPSQQKREVSRLENAPKIALLEAENINFDGGGLALRSPYLYRFAIENYIPQVHNGFIIGVKTSNAKNSKSSSIVTGIKAITNNDWKDGIHTLDSALLLSDRELASILRVGDSLQFPSGETRKIIRVSESEGGVWFEGDREPISRKSALNEITITTDPARIQDYQATLFHRAFSTTDLKKIPIAWGRSDSNLRHRMGFSVSLNESLIESGPNNSSDQSTRTKSIVKNFSLDEPYIQVAGREVGLLRLRFQCKDNDLGARLKVSFWGDHQAIAHDFANVHFNAENGILIVPLDALPHWVALKSIKGLRVESDIESACKSIQINELSLHQRLY